VLNEYLIERNLDENWLWPNFKVLSLHSPGGTEKNHENVSQDSRFSGRDVNPRPPKYEALMLITKPQSSAKKI
jgi:hypothetical protein